MQQTPLRLVGVAALVVLVVAGVWLSGKPARDSHARRSQAGAQSAEEASPRVAPAEPERDPVAEREVYESVVNEDVERYGVAPFDVASMHEPNRHAVHLQDARLLRPGRSWRSKHLVVSVHVEKVTYQQHGASVSAPHIVATVRNISDVPVAYNVRMRSNRRGHCEVRGVHLHNAVALAPDETASVVVCAGRGGVRLEHVEVLEISTLGYHYIGGLPPDALGIDPVIALGHQGPERALVCAGVDVSGLGDRVRSGQLRWVDVADFYSRHNCTRWQIPPGYRHTDAPLLALPVTP